MSSFCHILSTLSFLNFEGSLISDYIAKIILLVSNQSLESAKEWLYTGHAPRELSAEHLTEVHLCDGRSGRIKTLDLQTRFECWTGIDCLDSRELRNAQKLCLVTFK